MFPLSDQAELALLGAAILLACAGVFALALRWRPLALAPLVGLGIFAIQQFREGSGEYEYVADVTVVGAVTGLVGAAFVWVYAIKRLPLWARGGHQLAMRRMGQAVGFAALVAAPAALWAGFAVQRQYLPDAPCATEAITVKVGDTLYRVPIGFEAWLDRGSIGTRDPGRRRIQPYSLRTRDKEIVHEVCRQTLGGSRPLRVFGVRLYSAKIEEEWDRLCQEPTASPQICRVREEIDFGDFEWIRLTTLPGNTDDILASLRWEFNGTPKGRARVEGELRDGFVCWTSDTPHGTTRCYVMLPVDDATTAIVETGNISNRTPQQIQSDAEQTLDVLLNVLLR